MTEKNKHYADQNGHALRGVHADVVKRLKGNTPESLPGFIRLESWRRRKTMRRIVSDGK